MMNKTSHTVRQFDKPKCQSGAPTPNADTPRKHPSTHHEYESSFLAERGCLHGDRYSHNPLRRTA